MLVTPVDEVGVVLYRRRRSADEELLDEVLHGREAGGDFGAFNREEFTLSLI